MSVPSPSKATRAWTFSEDQNIRSSRNWERVAVADPIGRDGREGTDKSIVFWGVDRR